jgi:hypothetical protein
VEEGEEEEGTLQFKNTAITWAQVSRLSLGQRGKDRYGIHSVGNPAVHKFMQGSKIHNLKVIVNKMEPWIYHSITYRN